MQQLRCMEKEKTVAKKMTKSIVLENIKKSLGTTKTSRVNYMVTPEQVQDMDVLDLVRHCLKEKKLVSFGLARKVCIRNFPEYFGTRFRQSDCAILVTIFCTASEGADALLVNAKGQYAPKVADRHQAWLDLKGYNIYPSEVAAPRMVAAIG